MLRFNLPLLLLFLGNSAFAYDVEVPYNEFVRDMWNPANASSAGGGEVKSSRVLEQAPPPRPQARPIPPRPVARPAVVAQAEPTPTPSVNTGNYSTRPLGFRSHSGEGLVALNSCGTVELILGKDGRRCGPATVAQAFAPMLMKNIPQCVAEASRAAGYSSGIKKMKVFNADGYQHRRVARSRKMSMHSTGRAFDVWRITVQFNDGRSVDTPMTIASKNKPFYRTFNSCWRRLNNGCDGRNRGLLDCDANHDHHSHVHLSMPYCPRRAGIAGT